MNSRPLSFAARSNCTLTSLPKGWTCERLDLPGDPLENVVGNIAWSRYKILTTASCLSPVDVWKMQCFEVTLNDPCFSGLNCVILLSAKLWQSILKIAAKRLRGSTQKSRISSNPAAATIENVVSVG